MAEATGATTTTDTIAATVSDATTAPIAGDTVAAEAPAEGAKDSTITVGVKGKSALERATEALEKHDAAAKGKTVDEDSAAEKAKDAEPAKADGDADGDADKDQKTAEAAKEESKPDAEKKEEAKEEPRLAKGLALLAQREERARIAEKRASDVVKAAEAKAASITAEYGADISLVRSVRDLVAKGDQLGAVEALGINLAKAVELMSRKIEPTAEDIQRRIVREEFEAREVARKEADAKEATIKAEREAAAREVDKTEFLERIFTIRDGRYVPAIDTGKYPFTTLRNPIGDQLWQAREQLSTELGRKLSHLETLDRIESSLKAEYESATKLLKPAEVPSAPVQATPPKPAETPKPKASEREEKPVEQQSRKPMKRESASARAEAALKRAGL